MRRGETGHWEVTTVGGERVRAFVPAPLPPEPPLVFEGDLQRALEAATLAVGRLDGVSLLLPDKALFLYAYVRKEAVLSSQIEGTQSSLSDLLLFELDEAPGAPLDDVVEVSNYVAALDHGLARLREGFPLSNRLIREIHAALLSRGRGSDKEPGEFRRAQVWIGPRTRAGNAQFVPPPHTAVGAKKPKTRINKDAPWRVLVGFGCSAVRLFGCSAVRLFGCSVVRLFGCSVVWMFGCPPPCWLCLRRGGCGVAWASKRPCFVN